MAKNQPAAPAPEPQNENLTQLATRIPASLHRRIKMHCVSTGASIMEFIVTACGNHLDSLETPQRATGTRGRR
jgi:predicted HicB family RNase H-like nuclease